ncbi:MAG TPA: methylene-tetrahydromethanopterin dehydrogenase N-terminal domain-containing protein [Gemmatales bacterium]|nr:methylene-tetrahydromethanopterin dehydrogenase N-terminal domain-containing protein [Gemmatales bacterium]
MSSSKKKLLIQIDIDNHPSLFDRIVATDAGADEVISFRRVSLQEVKDLVHGCIFTRGPQDLSHTAIFVGGSHVRQAEAILAEVQKHFLPQLGLSVSVMFDANGCNTTAAAAVRCAVRHMELANKNAVVLGAGAVGQRITRLLASQGAKVMIGDIAVERANDVCEKVQHLYGKTSAYPFLMNSKRLHESIVPDLIFCAGSAGKTLLSEAGWKTQEKLQLMIDVNAVPPLGIEGIEVTDAGQQRGKVISYGALGVGNLKMKIHKAALAQLFTSNKLLLDIEAIFELSASL